MEKRKYTYKEMIKHMKSKGIKFELMNEQDAIKYLRKENYYFKLTAYRKNFPKVDGKYIDLDFAYLKQVYDLDTQLRYSLLEMSLNLEHAIKTRIIDLITENKMEDGYSIVRDFREYDNIGYSQSINYLDKNKYSKLMSEKHHNNPAIWVLLETMSFGTLCYFLNFLYKRTQYTQLKETKYLLKYCKNIRNLAAHNNCLLLNFFNNSERILAVSRRVKEINTKYFKIDKDLLFDRKVHDLICLFYLCDQYDSPNCRSVPARYNNASDIVVLPASTWAIMPAVIDCIISRLS